MILGWSLRLGDVWFRLHIYISSTHNGVVKRIISHQVDISCLFCLLFRHLSLFIIFACGFGVGRAGIPIDYMYILYSIVHVFSHLLSGCTLFLPFSYVHITNRLKQAIL